MKELLFLLFYAIGCVLSYGRLFAEEHDFDLTYRQGRRPIAHIRMRKTKHMCVVLMSWFGFFVFLGLYMALSAKERSEFLRFSNKSHLKKYDSSHAGALLRRSKIRTKHRF